MESFLTNQSDLVSLFQVAHFLVAKLDKKNHSYGKLFRHDDDENASMV